MKKVLILLAAIWLMMFSFAGCAQESPQTPENPPASVSGTNDGSSKPGSDNNPEATAQDNSDIVDLTVLSSTMIYAEVYNMMTEPEKYIGKTIKMSGPYYAQYYDVTNQYYHFVIIEDATACCQQGLEFIWQGDHAYPDDYPEDGKKIEVLGVFDSYEEEGQTYYYIATDSISII